MNGYILSPECEDDLFEIWRYLVTSASLEFADRIASELFERFLTLAHNPGLGHRREDLTEFPVLFYRAFPYQYMIVYRRDIVPLQIVAVLHAKRDIGRILGEREHL